MNDCPYFILWYFLPSETHTVASLFIFVSEVVLCYRINVMAIIAVFGRFIVRN